MDSWGYYTDWKLRDTIPIPGIADDVRGWAAYGLRAVAGELMLVPKKRLDFLKERIDHVGVGDAAKLLTLPVDPTIQPHQELPQACRRAVI